VSLLESWVAAETATPGRTVAAAIRDMNAALGRRYTSSHVSRWRRGLEVPKPEVIRYMMEVSAPSTVREVLGVSPDAGQIRDLVDRLNP
jgi:hypothetical protein